ncbi:hypothetical protein BC834DRAFT_271084 [Gloeopeniophorella convolvens]|nr:hypothetical protein BC834DRAFT_271084 [Gloeopeniophorella convolvens]
MPTAEERVVQLEAALDDERTRRRDADELARRDIASLTGQLDVARGERHQLEEQVEALWKLVYLYRGELLDPIKEADLLPLACFGVEFIKDVEVEDVPAGPLRRPSAPVKACKDEAISIYDSDDSVQDVKPRIDSATPPPPREYEDGEIRCTTSPPSSPPNVRGRRSTSPMNNSATTRRRVETSPSPSTRGSDPCEASRPSRRPRLADSAVDAASPVSRRPSHLFKIPDSLIDRISTIAAVPVANVAPVASGGDYPDYVSRRFLYEAYGFAPQALLHQHAPDAISFRCKNVFFPQWVKNPGLPLEPGQPGTILTMQKDMLDFRPLTLFIRSPVDSATVGLYMGEYEAVVCPTPLANIEFQNLPHATRDAWADFILRSGSWSCFTSARTRIWLRKYGKVVTDSSVAETFAQHRAAHFKKGGKMRGSKIGLCKRDVLNAFDSGDETFLVYLLRPLSYDVAFSEDMRSRCSRASSGGAPPQSEVEAKGGNQPIDEPEPPSASRQ